MQDVVRLVRYHLSFLNSAHRFSFIDTVAEINKWTGEERKAAASVMRHAVKCPELVTTLAQEKLPKSQLETED
jgi:hypothetical protein